MSLRSLFRVRKHKLTKSAEQDSAPKEELLTTDEVNELWIQCPSCQQMNYHSDLAKNLNVCPHCDHHGKLDAYTRIEQLIDPSSWQELFTEIESANPLNFKDTKEYSQRLKVARQTSGASEAIITGIGTMNGTKVALAVMEFKFLGGSMGSVVGERIHRLVMHAIDHKLPVIIVSSSGGARMHEGLTSLFQMAKTSSALAQLGKAGLPYISLLTDPTYGGVSASYAMLGDIIVAEPKARIGFAGPRVIEETIRQKLPADFQSSEYLLEHGQIDLIIPRNNLKQQLSIVLKMYETNRNINISKTEIKKNKKKSQ